jgi:hypothetical protein
VNPVPGTDTGIVNTPAADSVFLNGFNSANGAGRVCEVPPAPGDSERIRIVRGVGTFTATNPIEVRSNAISPINTVAPMLATNPAFGGEVQPADAARRVDSAPPHNGAVPTSSNSSASAPMRAFSQRYRRTGAPAPAVRTTSSTPTPARSRI